MKLFESVHPYLYVLYLGLARLARLYVLDARQKNTAPLIINQNEI